MGKLRVMSAKSRAKKVVERKRTKTAIELCISGMTIREIAAKLGVSKSLVHKNIQAALASPIEGVEELRRLEAARLDARELRTRVRGDWADDVARNLLVDKKTMKSGKVVEVIPNVDGASAFARVATDNDKLGLAVSARRAELLGLNVPTKQEPPPPVQFVLNGLTDEQLARIAGTDAPAAGGAPEGGEGGAREKKPA